MSDQKPTPPPTSDSTLGLGDGPLQLPKRAPDPKPKIQAETSVAPQSNEPTRSEPLANPPPRVIKRGGVGFLTAALMSTIAAGAGAYLALLAGSRPDLLQKAGIAAYVPQRPEPRSLGVDAGNIAPLVARISAVEAELMSLKVRLDGGTAVTALPSPTVTPQQNGAAPTTSPSTAILPPSTPSLADTGVMRNELRGIAGRVTAIETRLAGLDPTGAGGAVIAGLQADLAGLKAIIATLQQQAAAAPSPAVTFAVANVAEAANRPSPFLIEYETLLSAMPGAPEVTALESFARSGVPTRAVLQERFTGLAPALATAAADANKGTGIWAWFKGLFAGMVTVQSASDASGTGGGAILTRAKLKFDQGDLSGSIGDIASIENPPNVVTDWVSGARKRLELESRISALRGAVGRTVVSPTLAGTTPLAFPTPSKTPPAPAALPAPIAKSQGTNP